MFKRRTLFILGAGASAEVGFPVGSELAAIISKKMDIRFEMGNRPTGSGDNDLFAFLTNSFQQHGSEYQKAGWLIRDGIGLSRSIDDFIDMHRGDKFLVSYGKAAIVKSILEAERNSTLFFGPGRAGHDEFSVERIARTWMVKLMQMLGSGISVDNVEHIFDQVSFIVYNYDRCLEFFLLHALQKSYGIDDRTAYEIVSTLDITHPYGAILGSVQFGSTRANYSTLASGIKTYTEQVVEEKLTTAIAGKIEQAETIVFLGFAYHDQNMLLLKPGRRLPDNRRIFGTAFGMSDSDVDVTSRQIDSWLGGTRTDGQRNSIIRLENKLKCADLFDYYAKSLTGA